MLNWVLSIMVIKGLLTKEEAEYLAKELVDKIHPHDFLTAHTIVEKVLKDYRRYK